MADPGRRRGGLSLILIGWISSLFGASAGVRDIDFGIVGVGAAVAGAITYLVSGSMPARTEGAKLAAMLNAYRRTLEAAIVQANSLEQVVVMRPLPWVGSPTEEIAWAVAFNLDRQIDSLLSQSLEGLRCGRLADRHPGLVLDPLAEPAEGRTRPVSARARVSPLSKDWRGVERESADADPPARPPKPVRVRTTLNIRVITAGSPVAYQGTRQFAPASQRTAQCRRHIAHEQEASRGSGLGGACFAGRYE